MRRNDVKTGKNQKIGTFGGAESLPPIRDRDILMR
jgi:hypothetical protein